MSQHIPLKELFEYERGQLSHDQRTIVERHLDACVHCAENMTLFSPHFHAPAAKQSTAPAHQREPDHERKDGCPPPEEIGRFINNELPKRQQREVETHLAVCDACRRQLVAIVQASFAPMSEEEKEWLEALPPFEISDQVNTIKKLMPSKTRLLDIVRHLPERLAFPVPTFGIPRPAWALAVILVLGLVGKWWAWPTYRYYRLLWQGESQLVEQFPIYYYHALRPAHDYRSSDEAERMGPEGKKQTIDTLLTQALRYKQDGETARQRLAQYFLLQEMDSFADSLLKLLEAASPQNAAVLNDRGIWLYHQQKFDAAAVAFQRASDLNPRLDEALYNLAITQTQLGNIAAAEVNWEKYIALENIKAEWRNAAKAQLQELKQGLRK